MPQITCPFVMCKHNESNVALQPGKCLHNGVVTFSVVEDEDGNQTLECLDFAQATVGEKKLRSSAETITSELLEACKKALPFVAHFRTGWSTHPPADISSELLAQQLEDVIAKAEGRGE